MVYRGGKYPEKANGGSSANEPQRAHDAAAPQTVGPAEPAKPAKAKRKPGRIWAAALVSVAAICLVCSIAIFGIQPVQSGTVSSLAASAQASSKGTQAGENDPAEADKNTSSAQSASSAADDPQEAAPDTATTQTAALEYRPIDDPQAFNGAEYRTGAVLVSFKEGVDPQEALAQLQAETGIAGITCVDTASDYVELALPDNVSVKDAKEQFVRCTVVDAVQPNFVYRAMEATGETASQNAGANASADKLRAALATTLGVQRVETNDSLLKSDETRKWWLESVHANEAWFIAKGEDGGDNAVTVAVIDDSIDPNHEDLKDNVVKDESGNVIAYNAVDDELYNDVATLTSTSSTYDHGTHVAGIVAAEANNEIGVAGVSYNARILPIHAGDGAGHFEANDIEKAYDYILKNQSTYNIRVINMSLGGKVDSDEWGDDTVLGKIDEAWKAGIVTVTAAGNKGENADPYHCYPGDYDTCVNVINLKQSNSSTDPTEVERNPSSNYNLENSNAKDISAPGTSIFSTINKSPGYDSMDGTSMAAPCVAGIMALVFACDPSLTPEQAVGKLYASATDLNDQVQYGHGEVNAFEALKATAATLEGTTSVILGGSATLRFPKTQTGTWTWTASNSDVIDVSGNASEVTYVGKAPGTAIIRGTNGTAKAAATVSVYDTTPQNVTIAYGNSAELKLPPNNPESTWAWSSSNENIVSVGAETGVATALGMNSPASDPVTVTATLKSNPSIKTTVQVKTTKADLSSATVTAMMDGSKVTTTNEDGKLFLPNRTYTGSQITFDNLALQIGPCSLPYDEQVFSVAYDGSNINITDENPAKITLEAKQGEQVPIQGSMTVYFRIVPKSIRNCKITYAEKHDYTGSSIKLGDLKVVDEDEKTLTPDTDYTIEYPSDIVNAGTKQVTITGKGEYAESKVVEYTISPVSITDGKIIVSGLKTLTYNGTAQKQSSYKLTLKNSDGSSKPLTEGADYSVSYQNNTNAGTATIAFSGGSGGNIVSSSSNPLKKTFKITPANLGYAQIYLPKSRYDYTGNAIQPIPTVDLGTLTLRNGSDYKLTYSNNVNVGTGQVTITSASSNFTGSTSKAFRISAISISKTNVSISPTTFAYTGSAIMPAATVRLNGTVLPQSTNYTVTYQSNVSVGTGYATIKGKGNCTGTKTLSFTITPAAITQVKLTQTSYVYNGTARKPAALVYSGSKLLQNGLDYVVSYNQNVSAGTATAIIRGIGNYTGYKLQKFTITKAGNTLTVKAKAPTVKLAKVRKATQVIKRSKALTVSKARGTITYTKVSGSKRLTIAKKSGNITVKRGTPRGTYSIKVKVRSAGTANYKAKTKTVTIKVRVR